jgi:hypothetical protein
MTNEELNAIEARAKAATEGPWRTRPTEHGDCAGIWHGDWEHDSIVQTDSGVYPPMMPDAEFIAHARSDVPALVEEVRRLRALAAESIPLLEYAEGRWQRIKVPGKGDGADEAELTTNISLVLAYLDRMVQP